MDDFIDLSKTYTQTDVWTDNIWKLENHSFHVTKYYMASNIISECISSSTHIVI